jgi:predicted O-methyltransferase YrrM
MPEASSKPVELDEAGQSLAHLGEIALACLDAAGARSVVEIGSRGGDFTRELASRAAAKGGRVIAIDPAPEDELVELAGRRHELELVREPSLDALSRIEPADAVIVDGDHNYFTVSNELGLIEERAGEAGLPLLLLHDVCWPHARRDTYYAPDRIPERDRQPIVENAALAPGEPGVAHAGLRYPWAAAREGGPRNGVLTAVEEFVGDRDGVRLAVVPIFYGLGIVWRVDAPWAGEVAAAVDPIDRDPVLERVEEHRIMNLVESYRHAQELGEIEIMRGEGERNAERVRLLRTMLRSRAFAWAERLSRLRKGGRPAFSRDEVRRALGDDADAGR